jgi:hypothetical protein
MAPSPKFLGLELTIHAIMRQSLKKTGRLTRTTINQLIENLVTQAKEWKYRTMSNGTDPDLHESALI